MLQLIIQDPEVQGGEGLLDKRTGETVLGETQSSGVILSEDSNSHDDIQPLIGKTQEEPSWFVG